MDTRTIARAALALAALAALAGCTHGDGLTRAERLARYQAHAGAPVDRFRYFSPIGFEEVDDQHIVVNTRPGEAWLLRISGPCLDYGGSNVMIGISSQAGWVSTRFDRVSTQGSPVDCRIEEIRPLDVGGMRRADAAAGG